MNSIEITDVAPQAEDTESVAARFAALQQPAPRAKPGARPRYTLLISIALLLASLAFISHNWINAINAQLEMIRADFSKPMVLKH